MIEHDKNFPATGTAGGPRDGGCAQPSCENCEELAARVAVLEEERKILARERDEARAEMRDWRDCAERLHELFVSRWDEEHMTSDQIDAARVFERLREEADK